MTAPLRLFVENPLSNGASIALSRGQAHYLAGVMRRGVGDPVDLFNGRDGEWRGRLSGLDRKGGAVAVETRLRDQQAEPDIHLLFAPVKRAPIDYLAQKATELGVAALRPVITRRTVAARVNLERLRANAVEAAEQTGRLSVPDISPPAKLDAVLDAWDAKRRLIFCDEAGDDPDAPWGGPDGRARPLAQRLADTDTGTGTDGAGAWAILIGPEGGFDAQERARLRAAPFVIPSTLGPRILRADTAALAALAVWQSRRGDWT